MYISHVSGSVTKHLRKTTWGEDLFCFRVSEALLPTPVGSIASGLSQAGQEAEKNSKKGQGLDTCFKNTLPLTYF